MPDSYRLLGFCESRPPLRIVTSWRGQRDQRLDGKVAGVTRDDIGGDRLPGWLAMDQPNRAVKAPAIMVGPKGMSVWRVARRRTITMAPVRLPYSRPSRAPPITVIQPGRPRANPSSPASQMSAAPSAPGAGSGEGDDQVEDK